MRVAPDYKAYKRATKTPEAELGERRGDLGGLIRLANAIREAAAGVARAVESLAWDIDRERRGALSVGARQDMAEVHGTIEDLLAEQLLSERDRDDLRRHVRAMVDPEFAKTWPAVWDAELRDRAGMPPLPQPAATPAAAPKKGSRKPRRSRR